MPRNKRDHGAGNVTKLEDGTYSARVMVTLTDHNGSKHRTRLRVRARTKGELADKIKAAKVGAITPTPAPEPTPPPTIQILGERWLQDKKSGGIDAATSQNYSSMLRNHINPEFGHRPVTDIGRAELQAFLFSKKADGRADDKGGLSTVSVNRIHAVLNMLFDYAVKNDYIISSPALYVERIKERKQEARYLSDQEMEVLLKAAAEAREYAMIQILLGTGLRRGELLGLRWKDVDLLKEQIVVRFALRKHKRVGAEEGAQLGEPKTPASRRTVPLNPIDVGILKKWKILQDAEKKTCMTAYIEQGLVFCNADGSYIYPDTFSKWVKRLAEKAGLYDVGPHTLRHTFATRLIKSNVQPKVIQSLMGHTSIKTTMDTYGHLVEGMTRDAIKSMEPLGVKQGKDKKGEEPERES